MNRAFRPYNIYPFKSSAKEWRILKQGRRWDDVAQGPARKSRTIIYKLHSSKTPSQRNIHTSLLWDKHLVTFCNLHSLRVVTPLFLQCFFLTSVLLLDVLLAVERCVVNVTQYYEDTVGKKKISTAVRVSIYIFFFIYDGLKRYSKWIQMRSCCATGDYSSTSTKAARWWIFVPNFIYCLYIDAPDRQSNKFNK